MEMDYKTQPTILIIDPHEENLELMQWVFRDEFQVLAASDIATATTLVQSQRPTVTVLDIDCLEVQSEPAQCLESLVEILDLDGGCKLVVLGDKNGNSNLPALLSEKTYNYLPKPVDFRLFRYVLEQACWEAEKEERNLLARLRPTIGIEHFLGTTESMRRVFDSIRKVAPAEVPVLITGESGTGKELSARAIHKLSGKRHGPFVAINCGAIPEQLLESELFGHEKGSFTGAWRQSKGKIEYANRGTLFLDEIGELPVSLQVKLLRFLEDHQIERVGGRKLIAVDTRILAATKTDLHKAMAEGKFREDLYYRLSVFTIDLPPLRTRKADMHLIARVFVKRASGEMRKKVDGLSKEAIEAIDRYSWPGNVRELLNKIRRGVIMAEGPLLTPRDLELPYDEEADIDLSQSFQAARDEFQAEQIVKALSLCDGNINKVAKELGLSRPTVYYFLNKYGLQEYFDLLNIKLLVPS